MSEFLSAEKLKISEAERAALIDVLGLMESGAVKDFPPDNGLANFDVLGDGNFYNQSNALIRSSNGCGTACCIGGWVGFRMGMTGGQIEDYVYDQMDMSDTPIWKLYWENTFLGTSVRQGAEAIRNFLTLGDPKWAQVMHGESLWTI